MRKILIYLGTLLFIFAMFLPFSEATVEWDTGLVGYWPMDEGSGVTINSTNLIHNFTCDAALCTWRSGLIGSSTVWDGTSGADGVIITNVNDFEQYTWSLWVNSSFDSVVSRRIIMHDTPTRIITVVAGTTVNISASIGGLSLQGPNAITENEWTLVTMTAINGSMRIYINGRLANQRSITIGTTSTDLDLAKHAGTHDQFYNGTMDELGYWNRTLIPQEIFELYNNGIGLGFNNQTIISFQSIESVETETLNLANIINVSGTTVSSALLSYDGSSRSETITITNLGGGLFNMSNAAFDTPLLIGDPNATDREWFFTATLANGTIINSTIQSNLVNRLRFESCSDDLTTLYANFTFANETTAQEALSASFLSTWVYYAGSRSITKSLTFNDATENPSYVFCGSPTSTTILAEPTVTYNNAQSQARGYEPGILTLTSTVTDVTLFLLPTGLGIFATIQVLDLAGFPIIDARITLSDTEFGNLESRTTSSSGAATFFVDPFNVYTITATASGFASFTGTNMFSTTEFTIILSGAVGNVTDPTAGITFTIAPTQTFLANNTNFTFQFDIDATRANLETYGFFLSNGTEILATSSVGSTGAGTLIELSLNTENQTQIIMNAFYIVGDSIQNITRIWVVRDDTVLTQWSIRNFSDRLAQYLSDGIFGLTRFGLGLLVYLLILIITGVLSFRFALNSPLAIASIAFTLTAFFDVALGIFPNPVGAVPHFPTVLMGMILITAALREVYK